MNFQLTAKQRELIDLIKGPAKHSLAYGGSRCVSGDAVLDGHSKTIKELADAGQPILVYTSRGYQMAEAPFRKGSDRLLKFEMNDGRLIKVTSDHRFWNGDSWVYAKDISCGDSLAVAHTSFQSLPLTSSVSCPSEFSLDAQHLMKKPLNYQDGYYQYSHQYDQQPRQPLTRDLVCHALQFCEQVRNLFYHPFSAPLLDNHTHRQQRRALERSQLYQEFHHSSMTGDFPLIDQLAQSLPPSYGQTSVWFQGLQKAYRQSLMRFCHDLSFLKRLGIVLDLSVQSDSCDIPCESGYKLSSVKRITRTAKQSYYTLHVPQTEQYYANGFLNHNSGKTFGYVFAICARALRAPGSRHVIFRKHGVAVKQSVGKDTLPKCLELAFSEKGPTGVQWKEQDGYFLFPNGSEVWLSGLDDKERVDKVLGKEFATLYFNEASEIPYQSYLTAQTRLAQQVKYMDSDDMLPLKSFVDLNPTMQSHWTHKLYVQGMEPESKRPINREDYRWMVANPMDNKENLPPDYLVSLEYLPEAQKRRFFLGEYTGDSQDALWTRASIDRLYVLDESQMPDYKRIVVAIDPAISNEAGSDETGIIVAALDKDNFGYVLADASGKMKPEEWARKAVSLYNYYEADKIIAETNQGGDMVESTVRAINPNVSFTQVKATRGKYTRAEPIAALYSRNRVKHVGEFQELEDQMCSFKTDLDRKAEGYSPDRVDALVWAMTDLFPSMIQDRKRAVPNAHIAIPIADPLEGF